MTGTREDQLVFLLGGGGGLLLRLVSWLAAAADAGGRLSLLHIQMGSALKDKKINQTKTKIQ